MQMFTSLQKVYQGEDWIGLLIALIIISSLCLVHMLVISLSLLVFLFWTYCPPFYCPCSCQ